METIKRKLPFLLIISILLVIGVGLAYGYFFSQDNFTKDQLLIIDREITEANLQLEEIQSSETVSAETAKKALSFVEKSEIKWSKLFGILLRVVPTDQSAKQKFISFNSYSANENGSLSFNGNTIPSTNIKKQLDDIADTMEAFNEVSDFTNIFIPSISRSVTRNEETVLSLIFNVEYNPSLSSFEDPSVPRR